MKNDFLSIEGLVLRVVSFRECDRIITLFTPQGILKLFIKGKNKQPLAFLQPFHKIEAVYQEQESGLHRCLEVGLLYTYSKLKTAWLFLKVASDLLKTIFSSQIEYKANPEIYQLLLFYLDKIPHSMDPWALAASFRLKILKAEGILSVPLICSTCQQALLEKVYWQEAEPKCELHAVSKSLCWQADKLYQFYQLTTCKHYKELAQQILLPAFFEEIDHFFRLKLDTL